MAGEKEHLEKLIFEVYGAEEGARKIDDLRKAEDKHAKSIRGLKKEAKARAKAEVESSKKIAKAKEDESKRVTAAQERINAVMAKGALAITALAAAAAKAASVYAGREAAEGRLARAFTNTNARMGEYSAAQRLIIDNASKYGVSVNDQTEGLAQLADSTGSVTKATEDLQLAIDISAAEGRDLLSVIEMLRKARNGEVTELVNLNNISKTQAETLAKIPGDAERGAEAIKRLSKAYKGAADETQGTQNKLDAFKETAALAVGVAGNLTVKITTGLGAGFSLLTKEILGTDTSLKGLNTSLSRMDKFIEEGTLADYLAVASAGDFKGKQAAIQAVVDKANARAAGKGTGKNSYSGGAGGGIGTKEVPDYVAPMKKKKKRGTRAPKEEGDVDDLTDILEQAQTQAEEEVRIAQWLQDEKFRLSVEGSQMRERDAEYTKEINEKLATDLAAIDAKAFNEKKKKLEELKKAQIASAMATGEAVAGGIQTLSNSFVKGEGTKAVISGAVESARAIAAYAGGNIPGGIGHTAAAAAFFKVAADAGKGGGKGGGATRAATTSSATDQRDYGRENLQAVGRRDLGAQARAESYVININTAFPPSPEDSRNLADAISNEMRNRS